jgi:hypothetical protein
MDDMAKYLVLIYGDETQWEAMSEPEAERMHEGHRAFQAAAGPRLLDGHELEPASTARSVRRVGVTDGPFVETKEGIGGYYLLEAADLDEATALAARLPEVEADHSGVEVRRIHG